MISLVTFIIEDEQASQGIENPALFKIVEDPEILLKNLGDSSMINFLILQFDAAIESSIKD